MGRADGGMGKKEWVVAENTLVNYLEYIGKAT